MTDIVASLIKSLGAADLEGFASNDYASANREHRSLVRTAIAREIVKRNKGPMPMGIEKLKELSEVPRVKGWAISISHCPLIGGFVVGPASFHVGLDFEITNRVTAMIIGRVAPFPGEKQIIETLKNPARLWAAKEAAIKAFGNLANTDLNFAVVEITSMTAEGSFTASYKSSKAVGVVSESDEVTAAIVKTL